jgi:cysteinyl-tRNA synthetase
VVEALLDDLNTPQAIAALHGLRNASDAAGLSASLRLLGFLSESVAQWEGRKQKASGVDAAEIDRLIAERTAARARKDFKESDRIRDELAAKGVVIKDGKDAGGKPVTTWELA